MIDLSKFKIENPNLKLIRKGDLIYYEGPFLSHFTNQTGTQNWLYDWCDQNNIYNRWLIFEISKEDLIFYINGRISLLMLVRKLEVVYLADVDTDINFVNWYKMNVIELPFDYLPPITSFYNETFYTDYVKSKKKINENCKKI